MNIICEKCNSNIENKLYTHTKNNVTRNYLKCHECKKEYDVMFQDTEMRKFIRLRKMATSTFMYKLYKGKIDKLNEINKERYYK